MTGRGAEGPECGSTPARKKSSRAKPRLVADNPAPAIEAAPAENLTADPVIDDAAPLALEPRPAARPARAKRPVARPREGHVASIPPAVARPPRDRRRVAIGAVLAACVGGALVVGVVKAVTSRSHRVTSVAAAPLVASTVPEAKPILADYAPPDRDQVRRAFVNVGAVYRTEGLSGVVRKTMDCFSGLEQTPSYGTLDYCIAVDAYGEALQRKLAGGQPLAADSYFNTAQPRELKAAHGVVSADGDAGARVLDVRRLAAEVSQDGPAAVALVVAANEQTASEHPALAGPVVTEAPPSTTAHSLPRVMPVEPERAKVIPVKTAPPKVAGPKTAPKITPVVHTHAHVAPPVVRAHLVAKAAPHPHLREQRLQKVAVTRAPNRGALRVARPKLVRASVHTSRPVAPLHRSVEHARPHKERPNLIKVTVAMVRRAFAPKPSVNHASTHSRGWIKGEPDARPLRVASRGHVHSRESEPSDWVDCRHPRGSSEVRMCEGPTYGGGTLDDQYQHDRGRYR